MQFLYILETRDKYQQFKFTASTVSFSTNLIIPRRPHRRKPIVHYIRLLYTGFEFFLHAICFPSRIFSELLEYLNRQCQQGKNTYSQAL